jgi:hypothetical protein
MGCYISFAVRAEDVVSRCFKLEAEYMGFLI